MTMCARPSTGQLLTQAFPELALWLTATLRKYGHAELAAQIPGLTIGLWCDCRDGFCQTFTVDPPAGTPSSASGSYQTLDFNGPGLLLVDVSDGLIIEIETIGWPALT